jgi:aspartate-semialdehyde dehydrogenase
MAAEAIVALVGGETLLGADVRELMADRLPQVRTRLIGAQADDAVILTQEGGEAAVITPLDNTNLTSAQAVVLAGSPDSSRKAMASLRGSQVPVFDVTGWLEDLPEARLAPEPSRIQVVPHPAASTLVALLRTLHAAHTVERCVAQILAPASELGRAGVDELQKQTTQLLTFQPVEKVMFPDQLAYNLLAGTLPETELRIEKHIASLLGRTPEIPMPSLRLIQAPVMHGYSFLIWAQLGSREGVAKTLETGGFDLWPDDPPNVVSVAGQSGMSIGALQEDRNDRTAVWIWLVADQFRVAAGQCVSLLGAAL